MPVVLLLAAAVIVGGAIGVAAGWGGEMAEFPADFTPLALAEVTAADIALLRPPKAVWGYHPGVTEAALEVIAQAVTERDAEIERLRSQLSRSWPAAPAGGQEPDQDG